jgi:hypothetical protein
MITFDVAGGLIAGVPVGARLSFTTPVKDSRRSELGSAASVVKTSDDPLLLVIVECFRVIAVIESGVT